MRSDEFVRNGEIKTQTINDDKATLSLFSHCRFNCSVCKFLTVNHLNLPNLGLKSMSMAESLELYDKFNLARGVDMITVIDCGSN